MGFINSDNIFSLFPTPPTVRQTIHRNQPTIIYTSEEIIKVDKFLKFLNFMDENSI